MNLKDFLSNKEHPPELYWSIVAEEGWIQAGVWYIGESAAEVISISPGAAWSSEDEFVGAVDTALSSAIQKLPENYKEPSKTVFAVSSSWVKDGEITPEHLEKIKKLCAELSLIPVGFVVLPEAIAHLYKSEEGAPLNAIILGLGAGSLEISVFKLGNLVGTTQVSRSVSLSEDVIEGLSRFEGAQPLPSRFIVYDGKEGELEDAKDTLLQASWDSIEKIKFLHTPKAEILNSDRKVLATCLAGANEIGQVTQVDSKEIIEPDGEEPEEQKANVAPPEPGWEGETAEKFGFSLGADISEEEKKVPQPMPPPVPALPQAVKPKFNPAKFAGAYIQKTKNIFHSLSVRRGSPSPQKNTKWIAALIGAIILLILGVLYWWFIPKAKVTVFVTPKRFDEKSQVTFSTKGESDTAGGIVPASMITINATGEKTKSTTGVKLIGNKATGSVQIANGNSSSINLSAGTVLTSSTGLKFLTNSQASVSGQILPGSPGTATIDVTAADIGAQYNLPKGEVFGVGNYARTMVAGTSQGDFSGGSSQEVSAVSKDDQTNLQTELESELRQKAVGDALAKISSDQLFVDDWASVEITEQTFDHKVNDSADSLKLSLGLTAKGLAADKGKMLEFAKNSLKNKIPSGYSLDDNEIDFKFKFVSAEGDKYIYEVTIGANFLPQLDTKKIINQISGKTPAVVEDYLNSIPGFARAAVTLKPHLPGFLGTLPRITKNITLQVSAEQ